jgi:hypothetical protein
VLKQRPSAPTARSYGDPEDRSHPPNPTPDRQPQTHPELQLGAPTANPPTTASYTTLLSVSLDSTPTHRADPHQPPPPFGSPRRAALARSTDSVRGGHLRWSVRFAALARSTDSVRGGHLRWSVRFAAFTRSTDSVRGGHLRWSVRFAAFTRSTGSVRGSHLHLPARLTAPRPPTGSAGSLGECSNPERASRTPQHRRRGVGFRGPTYRRDSRRIPDIPSRHADFMAAVPRVEKVSRTGAASRAGRWSRRRESSR